MTLDELKAANALDDATNNSDTPQVLDKPVADDNAGVINPSGDDLDADLDDNSDGKNDNTESWMKSDELDSKKPEYIPISKHAEVRGKLKGKIAESNNEIEKLRAEIQSIKSQSQKSVNTQQSDRPKLDDFYEHDNPEESFTDALVDWKLNVQLKKSNADNERANADKMQKEIFDRIESAVTSHYERSAALSQSSNISADLFQKADLRVKEAVESISPNNGELIFNNMISNLGEGSEKVAYHLGVNSSALNEFKSALIDDPSGLKAMAFLGQKKQELSEPKKRYSNAPAPATNLNGNDQPSSDASFKKRYDAAVSSGDVQRRFDIRREAKAAGHNPQNW